MIMIKYGVSMLIMRLKYSQNKISASRNELSQTLVPFSVQLRLYELIFSFCDNSSFLFMHTYSIVMTDIYVYYVCIACSD